jgi:hypothetical protein
MSRGELRASQYRAGLSCQHRSTFGEHQLGAVLSRSDRRSTLTGTMTAALGQGPKDAWFATISKQNG